MNLTYLVKRVFDLNYSNLWNKLRTAKEKSGKNRLALMADMIYCGFKYEAGYTEYLMFEYYKLPAAKRDTYITRGRQNDLVLALNNKEYYHYFVNKVEFNRTFAPFVKRGWICLNEADKQAFAAFVADKDAVAAKPVDGMCGEGVSKIKKADYPSADAMYDDLKARGLCLVEELIVQHPRLAEIHPDSVNTVRMVTILKEDGEVDVVFAGLRIGSEGSFLDNMATGGMCAKLDPDTGVIAKPGTNYRNQVFESHPITGVKLVGREIPHYDQVRAAVREAAKVVPQVRYVGWDVAVTADGIDLIEGNEYPGHLIIQEPAHLEDGIGLWPQFRKYINR